MNKTREASSNSDRPLAFASSSDASQEDSEEDSQLVSRAQRGDFGAFDTLVLRHQGQVFAMIRNMISREADAWDLSQEVFIKAWNALPRFEARAKFSTWLFRIVHNAVYDWRRAHRREAQELNDEIFDREKAGALDFSAFVSEQSPDSLMEQGELYSKIEAALAKLSPEHREVVMLKDARGLSYKEIADVMACTLGTVMSRLFYARQKLQTLLKDEYDAR